MPAVPRIRELVADVITPIAAYKRAVRARPGTSFLFESAPGPSQTSRFSIIGLGALGELRAEDGAVSLRIGRAVTAYKASGVFDAARLLLRQLAPDVSGAGQWGRFLGLYGAAAFEFAGYVERLPQLERGSDSMPDLHVVVPETTIVFDHFTHRAAIMSLASDDDQVRDDADVLDALTSGSARAAESNVAVDLRSTAADQPNMAYRDSVERAKRAIEAGDAFQIVLSQRWIEKSRAEPFDVYRALRTINPSPYMFYLDLGWGQLFGSSPEVLSRLDRGVARVRPLAGTKPRHSDPDEERRIAGRLKRDAKERAEHVMLVDLGRNDLGKTCADGSVRVTDLLSVEYYSHVMHLVSEVRGSMLPERDAFDLFAATFPAGTVSGAPKIRAMELIAQLEGERRGFYGGSVGYFGFDGSMDACITLRSMLAREGAYRVQAGAGIVADSDPASEDRECRAKAAAAFEALRMAGGGETP